MAGRDAAWAVNYARHHPEQTLVYQLVEEQYPTFATLRKAQGRPLPAYVQRESRTSSSAVGWSTVFCGRCEHCHDEKLVAFSCKRCGFCPSCGARRMVESAPLLVDEVLPEQPIRQWVLSVPFAIRFLFVADERLALTRQGEVRYRLKTPYRDGTTHIILAPLDFIARLAAQVTPGRHGRRADNDTDKTPAQRRAAMTWAQRLKRVFRIDIE